MDLIAERKLIPLIDDRILYEYRIVLRRPRFYFDEGKIDELLATIDRFSVYVESKPLAYSIPDSDDLPFLEVALSDKADALITGNKKDFGKPRKGLRILSPAEFLDFYRRAI